jgi:hypothetical protein
VCEIESLFVYLFFCFFCFYSFYSLYFLNFFVLHYNDISTFKGFCLGIFYFFSVVPHQSTLVFIILICSFLILFYQRYSTYLYHHCLIFSYSINVSLPTFTIIVSHYEYIWYSIFLNHRCTIGRKSDLKNERAFFICMCQRLRHFKYNENVQKRF